MSGLSKTILVTGANGLLGQKLVDKLADRPAITLIASGKGGNRNPNTEGYIYVPMDITSEEEIEEVFRETQPDVVIHGAAMTHVDHCEQRQDECWLQNVTATGYLINACRKHSCKMVFVSTDFIFDGLDGPYDEKAKPNPVSHYGRSKQMAEELVMDSGVEWAIARTMLVYGVVADMSRSNIVLWAKKALEAGQEIKVVDDQFRCPTLAEDLAEGLILIVMKEKTGIYNISGPEMMSILEMVQRVADHFELDKNLIKPTDSASLNQPAKRPPKTGFVIIKAQSELGYRPRTLAEGLALVEKQLGLYTIG